MADHQQQEQAVQAEDSTASTTLNASVVPSSDVQAPATVSNDDPSTAAVDSSRSDDIISKDNDTSELARVLSDPTAAPRGRSNEIKAEDAQFAKRTISPSPTRSSLSAALQAHAPGLAGSRPGSRHGSRSGSPAPAPAAATGSPASGVLTPADLTTEEQLERLRHKVQDLSSQVTSLNGKLVASYNRVGNLEDDADQKVMEIRNLTSKVEKLEAERKIWEDKYEGGLLVEKDHVQLELTRMMDRVIEETASRGKAESDKANIEEELEQLSSQLFTEANKMVAMERMARLKAERKMEEIERSFKDTEELMMGQSAQMRDLGSKIDDLEDEREHLKKQVEELQHQIVLAASSTSSSSAASQDGSDADDDESDANGSQISIRSASIGGHTPGLASASLPDPHSFLSSSVTSQPGFYLQMPLPGNANAPDTPGSTSARGILITHPIQFLSFELPPFQEFVLWSKSLMRTRRTIMARPILDPNTTTGAYGGAYAAYGAPYGAAGMGQGASLPGYMSEAERQSALKESIQLSQYTNSPFIKRIVEEDSDPTLHLDNAPGLSFFSRRQIANAIIDGDLAIEPAFTSLPSDKCSLCGTSLAKFIASHQVTQPKDDPRKKLTRLATNWIPSSISGTATPTKEAQDKSSKDPWSISALTDALGSLTPSRELGGFSFGVGGGSSEKEKASQGHYTPYNPANASSRPGSSSGRSLPTDRKSSLPPLHRQASMSGNKADAENGNKDGVQHDYVLTQSASQQGQIYLFRSLESSTRYTLCPHYCLPRLRAVCELWTYVRNIHKGLLLEDNPKIYPSPFGTSNEYTKLFRKLTASVQSSQTQIANTVIQDARTPAPGLSRQLGDGVPPLPSSLSMSEKADDNKEGDNEGRPPIITTTNTVQGFDTSSAPVGLGLDMDTKKTSEPSEIGASSASSSVGDDESSAKPSEPSTAATSSESLPVEIEEGESKQAGEENKSNSSAPPLPSRPPRSAARSSPMTPSTSGDGGRFPTPSALSITTLKNSEAIESDKTPTQSPDLKQGEAASSQPTSAVVKPETFATPKSPKTPAGFKGVAPALPPRSPRFGGSGRPGPGRISLPSSGLSLSTSLKSEGGFSSMSSTTTPGLASAGTNANGAAGPVSTAQADWQQRCWYEVIRLKEGVFWSRVGANYNKEH